MLVKDLKRLLANRDDNLTVVLPPASHVMYANDVVEGVWDSTTYRFQAIDETGEPNAIMLVTLRNTPVTCATGEPDKLYSVWCYDGMDHMWECLLEKVPYSEARKKWNTLTKGGTANTRFSDIDYYDIKLS